MNNAIKTQALRKCYKNKVAVEGLYLEIRQGELFSLLGVNGAGKTTAIKMLSCLSQPTSGSAEVLGHDILKSSYEIKKHINVSPQESAVAGNLTVRENLALMCGIYGHSKAQALKIAEQSIKDFSLESIAGDRAKTLSGGWTRRLSIAMALLTEPDLLFLDEPTLGLDVIARRELWKIIERLKGRKTIILTTHYLEEAAALSDRIGVMAQGKLVACGTLNELLALSGTDNLEDAFITLCAEGDSL